LLGCSRGNEAFRKNILLCCRQAGVCVLCGRSSGALRSMYDPQTHSTIAAAHVPNRGQDKVAEWDAWVSSSSASRIADVCVVSTIRCLLQTRTLHSGERSTSATLVITSPQARLSQVGEPQFQSQLHLLLCVRSALLNLPGTSPFGSQLDQP
jgi:hypothetical protein